MTALSQPLIVLTGPTASGKSALAVQLAQRFPLEVLGADSVQVYRHLDIGSGKIPLSERGGVPHHLIDIVDPDVDFTAGDYQRSAKATIGEVHQRGRVPLVCGGTGLYIRALLYGLSEMPIVLASVKAALVDDLAQQGLPALYEELRRVDPGLASRVSPADRQRILRGLEVFRGTGQRLSELQQRQPFQEPRYRALILAIEAAPDHRERIAARVQQMLDEGLLDEVRGLLDRGYGPSLKSMQSLGYRQIIAHLQGESTLDEALQLIIRDHRRYAKRQRTWCRQTPQLRWIRADVEDASALVAAFLDGV